MYGTQYQAAKLLINWEQHLKSYVQNYSLESETNEYNRRGTQVTGIKKRVATLKCYTAGHVVTAKMTDGTLKLYNVSHGVGNEREDMQS